jgi:hypothetical protein
MNRIKFGLATFVSLSVMVPSISNADEVGYIRIGDKCFIDVGDNYPNLIQVPCPREVSENP